jgi:hypothetical protein
VERWSKEKKHLALKSISFATAIFEASTPEAVLEE